MPGTGLTEQEKVSKHVVLIAVLVATGSAKQLHAEHPQLGFAWSARKQPGVENSTQSNRKNDILSYLSCLLGNRS